MNAATVKVPMRAGLPLGEVIVGTVLIVGVVLPLVLAPVLPIPDPLRIDLTARLSPPGMSGHLLGTDELGRDMLSRLIWGGRSSVIIGFSAVLLSALVGVTVGLTAGFRGGYFDAVASRLIDVQLSLPTTMLLLMVIAIFGSSPIVVIAVLALANWVIEARLVRGMTLVEREKPYVDALRSMGATRTRIVVRHILPNIAAQLIVVMMLTLASALLLESALSFLGFGVQRPFPTGGRILSDGRPYITSAWWLVVLPGAAISILVVGVNLLGGAIQEAASGDRS